MLFRSRDKLNRLLRYSEMLKASLVLLDSPEFAEGLLEVTALLSDILISEDSEGFVDACAVTTLQNALAVWRPRFSSWGLDIFVLVPELRHYANLCS